MEGVPCGQPHAPGLLDSLVGNPGGKQEKSEGPHKGGKEWVNKGGKCVKLGDRSGCRVGLTVTLQLQLSFFCHECIMFELALGHFNAVYKMIKPT